MSPEFRVSRSSESLERLVTAYEEGRAACKMHPPRMAGPTIAAREFGLNPYPIWRNREGDPGVEYAEWERGYREAAELLAGEGKLRFTNP